MAVDILGRVILGCGVPVDMQEQQHEHWSTG